MTKLPLGAIAFSGLLLFCASAQAGTISLLSLIETSDNDRIQNIGPFATDAPPGDTENSLILNAADTGGSAFSAWDESTRDHRVGVSARTRENSPDAFAASVGRVEERQTYIADTAGTVTLDYTLDIFHLLVSDLTPLRDFYSYGLSLALVGETSNYGRIYESALDPDPIFLTNGGVRTLDFSGQIDVAAGEEFSVEMVLFGQMGQFTPIGRFFRGTLNLHGDWMVSSTGDFRPVPDDLAPVPLPAGLPLMICGLGALGCMRWREHSMVS